MDFLLGLLILFWRWVVDPEETTLVIKLNFDIIERDGVVDAELDTRILDYGGQVDIDWGLVVLFAVTGLPVCAVLGVVDLKSVLTEDFDQVLSSFGDIIDN